MQSCCHIICQVTLHNRCDELIAINDMYDTSRQEYTEMPEERTNNKYIADCEQVYLSLQGCDGWRDFTLGASCDS